MWDDFARGPDTVCAHEVPYLTVIIIYFNLGLQSVNLMLIWTCWEGKSSSWMPCPPSEMEDSTSVTVLSEYVDLTYGCPPWFLSCKSPCSLDL